MLSVSGLLPEQPLHYLPQLGERNTPCLGDVVEARFL